MVTHLLVARPDAGARLLAGLEPDRGPAEASPARPPGEPRRVIYGSARPTRYWTGAPRSRFSSTTIES